MKKLIFFIFCSLINNLNAQTNMYEKPIPANPQSTFVPLSNNKLNLIRSELNRREAQYDNNQKQIDYLIDWVFDLRNKETDEILQKKLSNYYKILRDFEGKDLSLESDNIRQINLSIKEDILDYNNRIKLKNKESVLRESEKNNKENTKTLKKSISINIAIKLAEKQFSDYLPKILKSHDAILDLQQSFIGDFTGDGVKDVVIYFSLAPKGGGNTIVGQGLVLYKNNGFEVKVFAGYEPNYMFVFDKIYNGKIYVQKLKYAKNDGHCCPSIRTEHILTILGSKVY